MYALAGVLAVAIGLGLYFQFNKYARFWEDWNPAIAEARGNMLIVKNKSNRVLWDTFLPGIVRYASHVNLSDLDGDGKTEVLVLTHYNERTTGKAICFNYAGKQLWEFSCGEHGVYQIDKELNSRYFSPYLIKTEDLNGDSKKEVIVGSGHSQWFPFQLALLDYKGNVIAEYWHPGRMNCVYCLDLDGDGKKEIILGGTNNRMGWRSIISVLDPGRISGQAMPYSAQKKIEQAKEKWYAIFPHIKERIPDESKWEFYKSAVDNMDVTLEDNKLCAVLNDGRTYYLSSNFEFNSEYFMPSRFQSWAQENTFPYELKEKDEENWKNIEVWKDGDRIR